MSVPTPSSEVPEALLRCPQCLAGALQRTAAGLRCLGCDARFPLLAGIPWLFAEPGARLAEWRQRFQLTQQEHLLEQARAAAAARNEAIPPVTRQRLERLAAAHGEQATLLRTLLAPIDPDAAVARYETLLALRTRTPLAQDLHSYYPNVHRDWAWGAAENAAALELVGALAGGALPGRLLVLGSGAGRLAWDVHAALGPTLSVALDLNPLLSLLAQQLARGGAASLYEFPIAPRSAADVAVRRELRAPDATRPGLAFVLGDALRAPFAPGSFDAVLTPWFVDIVPQELPEVATRINELLAPGGRWLNFGSLNYSRRDPLWRLSPQELPGLLAATGFECDGMHERELPYLQSPASRHGRVERVLGFTARRVAAAPARERSENLPAWIADARLPVPLLPHFESQALVNRIYAFVLALVDGRRSVAQIAAYLVEQKLMLPGEAEAAVRGFLATLYEESLRREGF